MPDPAGSESPKDVRTGGAGAHQERSSPAGHPGSDSDDFGTAGEPRAGLRASRQLLFEQIREVRWVQHHFREPEPILGAGGYG
jgi:hypothetical protein